MAEESISVPISPDIDIPDEVRSRSSEGKPITSKARATKQPDPRRASTGSLNNGARKFSSGISSSVSSGGSPVPVPHYLRASTGSCHDFCKYGKKHETEVKPWQTKARKMKNPTLNQQVGSEAGDSSEKKIMNSVKSKPPVSKTNSPSLSVSKNKVSSPFKEDKAVNEKKQNVTEKQNTAVFRKRRESDSGLAILPQLVSAKEKGIAMNEKKKDTIEKRNTPVSIGRREIEIKPDKTKGAPREVTRKLVSSPVAYLATKPSFTAILSSKGNKNSSKKPVSNHKDQNKIKAEHKHTTNNILKVKTEPAMKAEARETVAEVREKNQESSKEAENEPIENEKVTNEISTVLKVDSEEIASESKQNGNTIDIPSSEPFSSLNIENKVPELEQNENTSDFPQSESSSSGIASPTKSLTLSYGEEEDVDGLGFNKTTQNESTNDNFPSESVSSMNISSQHKPPTLSDGDEEAQVKYPKSEENERTCDSLPSESISSPNISSQIKSPALSCGEEEAQDEVEYLDTESDGSDDSISDLEDAPVGNVNSKTKKSKVVSDENDPATKLKFKRGKVVELESSTSGPRRLRFRRGRVLDENQDKDVKNRRRSFTSGGVDEDRDGTITNDDSEKVVLRHQEVEGRKDAQGLFNNVIEETASKLVETRKSKVKALVGAFETVISLQESKPATQTAPDEK